MTQRRSRWLVVLIAAFCLPLRADVFEYLNNGDTSFEWSVGEAPGQPYKLLRMTSQTWRDIRWDHSITVFMPEPMLYPDAAILFITGGSPREFGAEAMAAAALARGIGAPFAILWNIPNQPLFGGLNEDALISHTFAEALKSGEKDWPLLFPMAKSAVRAMDALQAWSEQELGRKITRFITCGASKRGWTTWFTGAVDPRVVGIMPMVYDNLNLNAQMRHQMELWGHYSPQINDYTEKGLQSILDTPAGAELSAAVDPFTYRDRITMPKLIINGTNDAYWTLDALNLYRDELSGPVYQLYGPNSGHGLQDVTRVLSGCQGFCHQVLGGLPEPVFEFEQQREDNTVTLTVRAPTATKVDLWSATAAKPEFTDAQWKSSPATRDGERWRGTVTVPTTGCVAVFAEATFDLHGVAAPRSTTLAIYRAEE